MGPRASGLDRDNFRRLFDERREDVFRFLWRLAGNAHDAEDLLQETFARLWRKRAQFRGDGSLDGYLRRIAYRTFLNARPGLRRARAPLSLDAEPEDGGESPADAAARGDLLREVRAAVDALPDGWREPFVLFRYEGMSQAEVADAMGLTPKAVEMRLRAAVRALAARVGEHQAERGGNGRP